MNSREWHYGLLGAIGAITAGAQTPLFALAITQSLVAFYSPDRDYMKREVSKIALIFCGAGVVTVFIYWCEHYFFGVVGEHLTMRVREMMFSGKMHQSMLENCFAF